MADQRPIGFWLKLVDRLIDERFAETLDEHGVTRRQWQLLTLLAERSSSVDELDQAIAPFLPAHRDEGASSADHLAELIESGWVVVNDEVYSVTERGSRAVERISEIVTSNRAVVMDGISGDEYEQVLSVLGRIARNLGWGG